MRILKYFVVGGIAAIIDLIIFVIFAKFFGFQYLIVGAVGFLIATLVNYGLSIQHVFYSGVRFSKASEVSLVILVSSIGLFINQMILFLLIGILNWDMVFAKIMATGSAFFWNYYSRKNYIFKNI